MRRILLILSTIAYVVFFGRTLLPTLSIYYDFTAWVVMAACALIAAIFARPTERWLACLALIVAIAGSIYTGHYNAERRAKLAEHFNQSGLTLQQ